MTHDSDPFGFDDLEGPAPRRGDHGSVMPSNIPMPPRVHREAPAVKSGFACQSCAGTGLWQSGRTNRHGSTHCFACGGKGSFKTSPSERFKNRERAHARKADVKAVKQEGFEQEFPGLMARCRAAASWMTFAQAMVEAFDKYGYLTDNQAQALVRSLDKADASRAAKQAASAQQKAASSGAVDAGAIVALFDKASGSGLKRPVFRTAAFDLSLAPSTGKNPGAIYVKKGETYFGKIAGGQFHASREAGPDTHAKLAEIVADPLKVAVAYGRLTGSCCCCGRELTDPVSVAASIGPVCAANWGLDR